MSTSATHPTPAQADRRNYLVFLGEGASFIFGMGFVNVQGLLPAFILEEGGPSWVAAYMPTIMMIGMCSMPLLNAHWVDGLPRLKPFMLTMGFFQRIVYLFAGALLLWGGLTGDWIWITLALAPLLSGVMGGLGMTAWQRLFLGGVPAHRRASNLAFRFLLGGVTGILAGFIIERVLERMPGVQGYGVLHLLAVFFFMISWVVMLRIFEHPHPHPEPEAPAEDGADAHPLTTMLRYYRPGPLQRSRVCFAGSLALMHGFCLVVPFYAVTLLDRLDQPKSFLGILAMWQMGGQSAGNLLAAALGDRWGGRATFGFGLVAVCLTLIPAMLVQDLLWAQLTYAGFSMSLMIMIIGKETLLMELSPARKQSSYFAGTATITMLAMVLCGLAAQWLWTQAGGFNALALATIGTLVLAFGCLSWVEDPRGVHINPLRAVRRGFLRFMR